MASEPGLPESEGEKKLKSKGRRMLRMFTLGVLGFIKAHLLPVILFVVFTAAFLNVVHYIKQAYNDIANAFKNTTKTEYDIEADVDEKKNAKDELNEWFKTTGDVDATDRLIEMIEKAEDGDEDAKKDADSLVRGDLLMISKEDLKYILDSCSYMPDGRNEDTIPNANNRMFMKADIYYTYHIWEHVEVIDPVTKKKEKKWIESTDLTHVSNKDEMYGDEYGLSIEGETKDVQGTNDDGQAVLYKLPRFATHWQDVATLAIMAGYLNYSKWDDTGDPTEYNPADSITEDKTDGYYINDETRDKCLKLFNYKFDYYYDSITDTTHDSKDDPDKQYLFEGLENGNYDVGYFFYKEDVEPEVNPHEPYYKFCTYYTPEAAPKQIENGFEKLPYTYCDVSDVPNYLPEGDIYIPPDGKYCCGRWDIIDSKKFVDALDEVMPEYKQRFEEYNAPNFPWYDEMMEDFLDNLSDMPASPNYKQPDYYREIKDLYDGKFIKVTYEGTRAGDFEAQLESIKDEYDGGDYEGFHVIFPLKEGCSQTADDIKFKVPAGWTTDSSIADLGTDQFLGTAAGANGGDIFHSYGVTYHGDSEGETGGRRDGQRGSSVNRRGNADGTEEAHYGSNVVIVTAHDSNGNSYYYPNAGGYQYKDEETGEYYGIVPIDDDAKKELKDQSDNLTLDEIRNILQYLQDKFGGKYPFVGAAQAVYDWQQRTGQSVTAVLAFILTEGTYGNPDGLAASNWNFWNFRLNGQSANGYQLRNGSWWLSLKKQSGGDFNKALIAGMDKVYQTFMVNRGQTTYYDMCFSGYGFPTTLEDAKKAGQLVYSYCPWYESAFNTTGNPNDLYPNRVAADRRTLLNASGKSTATGSSSIADKLESSARWFIKNVPDYNQYGYVDYDASSPFGNLVTGGTSKVREDCSGFASAFVSTLVPDMTVQTTGSSGFSSTGTSVGKALTKAGYTLKKVSDMSAEEISSLGTGAILVDPGHHVEVLSGMNTDGTMNTFGWGNTHTSYPSSNHTKYALTDDYVKAQGHHYNYIWVPPAS